MKSSGHKLKKEKYNCKLPNKNCPDSVGKALLLFI